MIIRLVPGTGVVAAFLLIAIMHVDPAPAVVLGLGLEGLGLLLRRAQQPDRSRREPGYKSADPTPAIDDADSPLAALLALDAQLPRGYWGPNDDLVTTFLDEVGRLPSEGWSRVYKVRSPATIFGGSGYDPAYDEVVGEVDAIVKRRRRSLWNHLHDFIGAPFLGMEDGVNSAYVNPAALALGARDLISSEQFNAIYSPFAAVLPMEVLAIDDPIQRTIAVKALPYWREHERVEAEKFIGVPPLRPDRGRESLEGGVEERYLTQHFVGLLVGLDAPRWLAVARRCVATDATSTAAAAAVAHDVALNKRTPHIQWIELMVGERVRSSLQQLASRNLEELARVADVPGVSSVQASLELAAQRATTALFVRDLIDESSFELLYGPFQEALPIGLLRQGFDVKTTAAIPDEGGSEVDVARAGRYGPNSPQVEWLLGRLQYPLASGWRLLAEIASSWSSQTADVQRRGSIVSAARQRAQRLPAFGDYIPLVQAAFAAAETVVWEFAEPAAAKSLREGGFSLNYTTKEVGLRNWGNRPMTNAEAILFGVLVEIPNVVEALVLRPAMTEEEFETVWHPYGPVFPDISDGPDVPERLSQTARTDH